MAVSEEIVLLRGVDENGNQYLLHPITKMEAVDGLPEELEKRKPIYFLANIGTAWAGAAAPYTQVIDVPGILITDNPVVDLVPTDNVMPTDEEEENWGLIRRVWSENGSIIVFACDKTSGMIRIQMEVKR